MHLRWTPKWLRKLIFSLRIEKTSAHGWILFGNNFDVKSYKNSRVLVGGKVHLGIPLNDKTHFSSQERTCVYLGIGSTLESQGLAHIAPGVSIVVGAGAHLTLGDGVIIAHNTQSICNYRVSIGNRSMISWNSTLIDSDEHNPVFSSGKILKLQKRPLVIGERVGMQANVLIPRGVNIGDLSVISAGTVLREDVPPEVFVYTEQKLRKKEGLTSGIK